MVILRGTRGTDQLLILGLSKVNVERLLNGQPIHIRRASHGEGIPEGWEIGIFYGETEEQMHEYLKKMGIVKPSTPTYPDPRLGRNSNT